MAIVIVMAGVGLIAGATGAGAAPVGTAPTASALPFSLTGNWTDYGPARPSIINNGNNIVVNMSYAGRPTAFGTVTGPSTIVVRFPDAGTFTATVPRSGSIRWSDGTIWTKVYTGPTVVDINGTWLDPVSVQDITNTGGYLRIVFRNGRPNGVGFVGNASTIQVTFPDDATYLGTIDPAGYIHWSNNTSWSRPIIR